MALGQRLRDASAGLLAAGVALAVSELLAEVVRPEAAPLVTIGGAVIDLTPTAVKEFAVAHLGTNDKPFLLGTITLVLIAIAAGAGLLARRRPAIGVGVLLGLGVLAMGVAATRPGSTPFDVVPGLVAGAVGPGALLLLTRASSTSSPSRRTVLLSLLGGGVLVGLGSFGLGYQRTRASVNARNSVKLPAPASPAPTRPPGLQDGFITANKDFYRVDVALTVPRIDPSSYTLKITGLIDRPRTLTLADLLKRPLLERDITLNCVSNEVGGPYIGTARWLGASLASLLREAGIKAGADQVVGKGADGMTIGTPLATVMDGRDALLVVGMNGEPLPTEHGFPVRMLTPGVYGYVGSAKWLTEIEVARFDDFDAYWVRRGWTAQAPVKTASRIDRPAPFARQPAGPVRVAGVAWAQHRGIKAVEVQVDNGPWQPAALAPIDSIDTWVQWTYTWTATAGDHTLRVRATDGTGAVQTDARATPFPNGATGWHSVSVTIG